MRIAYFNGSFLSKDDIHISPDDRGFLFADGIYEVVRWYEGFFYDMDGHMSRLRKSLQAVRIEWPGADEFPAIAGELIARNDLSNKQSLVYLQVTRGAAKRTHAFPSPSVPPTIYAFAWSFCPDPAIVAGGIRVIMKKESRWSRCDIKSVSLLPNILSFQEATENGCMECVFVRDGIITECAHSNIFFVVGDTLYTHPESESILSGISRKNVLRLAHEAGIMINETAVREKDVSMVSEAFITNTSFEVAPVISINNNIVANGTPGPVTMLLRNKFRHETELLRPGEITGIHT